MALPKIPENNVATSTALPDLKSVPTSSVRAAGEAFNPLQDLQRSQIAAQQAGLPSGGFTPPVKVPETTNAATLGGASTPNVPPAGATATPDAFVDSIGKSLETFNRAQQATQTVTQPLEAERSSLSKRFEQALSGITGRGQAQLDAERAAGVPEQQKQLQELNLQIAQRKAEYDKAIAALPGQGRGITTGIIAGQTAREQRMAAVELGSLASVAQAVQGNLALAQQTADRTVKLEFADRQQEVDNLKSLLDLNYDNLSRAEKKQADQLNFLLQERQNAIDQEKEDRASVLNLSAQAAQNGADTATLTKMSKAKTPEEALQIGGEFLQQQNKPIQVVADGRVRLVDPVTGDTIKDLGSAQEAGRPVQIGTDSIGNPIFGTFDAGTNTFNVTNVQNGVVGGYNISSYATDPNHESAVASILNNIGQFNTTQEIDAYIQRVAPGSPITGDMVAKTSEKFGVSWEMLVAMMQQDSNLGTAGKGARTFNPGNVGNDDAGNIRNYGNWQSGVDAVGNWLNKHRANTVDQLPADKQNAINTIVGSGKFTKEQVKNITNTIATGEDPFTVIKNNARNLMPSTIATDVLQLEEAQSQLLSIDALLKEFYDSGGSTDIFKGTYENILNKLGQVNDPRLVNLATQIQVALQAYRNAVSGTAYSVQEGADIASIFPGINKTEGLNTAIMNARIDSMSGRIDSSYRNVIGSVYDQFKPGTLEIPQTANVPASPVISNYLDQELGLNQTITNKFPTVSQSQNTNTQEQGSETFESKAIKAFGGSVKNWISNLFK